jgi:hypothetical protein
MDHRFSPKMTLLLSSSPSSNRMSIRLKDLHSLYQTVSHDEAIAIANLGAQTYLAAKEGLFEAWNAAQGAEEGERTERWRREGGEAMLASLKARLAAGEAAAARVATLQASIEAEVAGRIDQVLGTQRKDFELAKMEEILCLKVQIAEAKAREEMIILLQKQMDLLHDSVKSKETIIETLQKEVDKQKTANTKSSHAIGKVGEAAVLTMIQECIIPVFPFSRVEDKTGVGHAADFHLWTMPSPSKTVKILIDAKKYKTTIKMIEINKLHSDMDDDEEAQAGIMLSLDSSICHFNQFEIGTTPKHKMVMYITMEGMDPAMRATTLVWAVRVLTSIAGETDIEKQKIMILNIELFIKEIDKSVKDMDGCIKMCSKTLDTMRVAKEKLFTRLTNYKNGSLVESGEDEEVEKPTEGGDGKCKKIKSGGNQCGYKAQPGLDYCKRHI